MVKSGACEIIKSYQDRNHLPPDDIMCSQLQLYSSHEKLALVSDTKNITTNIIKFKEAVNICSWIKKIESRNNQIINNELDPKLSLTRYHQIIYM